MEEENTLVKSKLSELKKIYASQDILLGKHNACIANIFLCINLLRYIGAFIKKGSRTNEKFDYIHLPFVYI